MGDRATALRVRRDPHLTDTDASAIRSEVDRGGRAHLAGPGEDWARHARTGTGGCSERAAGAGSSARGWPGEAVEATMVRRFFLHSVGGIPGAREAGALVVVSYSLPRVQFRRE